MKKALIVIAVIVALLAIAAYVFRDTIGFMIMLASTSPDSTFAEDTRHPAPDYSNPDHWAALPDLDDPADVSPNGLDLDNQATALVDVFFIHPTTYYKADHWNQPLDDIEANTFTDDQVLRNQASVFNSCCRIYVPRYRQATLFSFMDDGADGAQAIRHAYEDVKAAFDHYMGHYNDNRPFILAGHSQGGLHADTLLKEVINGAPYQDLMVAAYPVGYNLDGSNGIPVCDHAEQTGCQVTWNAVGPEAPAFGDTSTSICVNPLNWTNDGSYAGFDHNLGAVSFTAGGGVLEKGITDAQCIDGRLIVTEVRSDGYQNMMFGPGNYHVYDYSFFHMNIRENAMQRSLAYLAK